MYILHLHYMTFWVQKRLNLVFTQMFIVHPASVSASLLPSILLIFRNIPCFNASFGNSATFIQKYWTASLTRDIWTEYFDLTRLISCCGFSINQYQWNHVRLSHSREANLLSIMPERFTVKVNGVFWWSNMTTLYLVCQ